MIHNLPDPDPGRCLNHRDIGMYYGRCLRVEGHDGPCRFEREPNMTTTKNGGEVVYTTRKPKPWIEPEATP